MRTSLSPLALTFAALLLLGGCASRLGADAPAEVDPAEDPELQEALRDLALSRAELSGRMAAGDCAEVCRLSGLVCEASGRLCHLARRHGQTEPWARHCLSSREECRSAQEQCDDCK